MGKVTKRITLGLVSMIAVATIAALFLFHAVESKIAGRMLPPVLKIHAEPAPDLIYRTLDGNVEHLASSKGKVVFLDLWGTWCIQCVVEMPQVQRLYDHYKNDPNVQFLIVSRMDSPSSVRSYAAHHRYDLPFYVTRDDDIPDSMHLNQFPATFIYARDGSMVSKHVGAARWSAPPVIAFINNLKTQ